MGRQIQLHLFPKDVNELLIAMHGREPLEVAMRSGNSAVPERLAFVPDNMAGQTLVMWSDRLAPGLQRDYVADAQPPYYLLSEQSEAVLELWLSGLTTWQGRPALTQGRIYGVFENKPPELANLYERIARHIRRHWRKNPAVWMGGYVGPAASDWFDRGGLLLPHFAPPDRGDWIQRIAEQHPV